METNLYTKYPRLIRTKTDYTKCSSRNTNKNNNDVIKMEGQEFPVSFWF